MIPYMEQLLIDDMPMRNPEEVYRVVRQLVDKHNKLVKAHMIHTHFVPVEQSIEPQPIQVFQYCTRKAPHICGVNGSCNGTPREDEIIRQIREKETRIKTPIGNTGLIGVKESRFDEGEAGKALTKREIADARALMIAWGFVCMCVAPVAIESQLHAVCNHCKRFIIENEKDEYR